MVRLVGQEATRACKVKAQSGALLRVGSMVVSFCLGVRMTKKKNDENVHNTHLVGKGYNNVSVKEMMASLSAT